MTYLIVIHAGLTSRKEIPRHMNFKAICKAILFEFSRRNESLGEIFTQRQSVGQCKRKTDGSEMGKESVRRRVGRDSQSKARASLS